MLKEFKLESKAYMPYPECKVPHRRGGPLRGKIFTVKDMFDVAGYPTSAGNPTVLAMSGIKTESSPLVDKLLDAGAKFDGKVVTDELAFSMEGRNIHFGAPVNGTTPERFAGGSSSGSASSVSLSLANFSLATDSGGSVRAPAAQCGLCGLRPTHGLLSLENCRGLCPEFDTAGIIAADVQTLYDVAEVLIDDEGQTCFLEKPKYIYPEDVLEYFDPKVVEAFKRTIDSTKFGSEPPAPCRFGHTDLERILSAYQRLQGRGVWRTWGKFIETYQPQLGPGVKERFAFARQVHDMDLSENEKLCRDLNKHVDALLKENVIMLLPTLPGPSPLLTVSDKEFADYRKKMNISFCLGGLTGVPWVTIPELEVDGLPIGLSFVAARGRDLYMTSQALCVEIEFGIGRNIRRLKSGVRFD